MPGTEGGGGALNTDDKCIVLAISYIRFKLCVRVYNVHV